MCKVKRNKCRAVFIDINKKNMISNYLATRVSNDPFVDFFLIEKNDFRAVVEYNLKSSIVFLSNSNSSVITSNHNITGKNSSQSLIPTFSDFSILASFFREFI